MRYIIAVILLLPALVYAENERYYQEKWCKENGGQVEVVMPDKTRCDCLTATHAIEFDFGKKWAEAIGQSLNYALQTNKKAGIVLILKKDSDYKYWIRLNSIIKYFNLPITTELIKPQKPKK